MFANELGEILDIFDTDRLIENGHGGPASQIGVHEKHRLEFLVISRKGIKGNQSPFLDDPSDIVHVAEIVEIFLDGKLSFLDQVNLFNFATWQAPQNLSDRNIGLVRLVVKPGKQHRV